jgi:hypothetical protein
MATKEQLAFLKANAEELSSKIMRKMEKGIVVQMRKAAADATTNAQRSD